MHNTPRDFFLHFGAFAALYAAATALGTLLFLIIDYAFPDPLYGSYYSHGYYDPYSGPMRFAIASLIIMVPLFLWLTRIIQREARMMPERYTYAIRRWLTYVTLFVAGATIVGDLITLVYSFLGGEFPTPFVLKVVTLFVVTGVIFWYFLLDIHGYWQNREAASKMVAWGTLVVALLVIIPGFFVMGSPFAQREIRFDQQEVQDLSTIQQQIITYWQQNGRLPAALSELESDITYFHVPDAPDGRDPYEYRTTDDLSFELCAEFGAASDAGDQREILIPYGEVGLAGNPSWDHEAGRTCFEREIDINLIRPYLEQMPQVDQVIP